jgi:hypothetical protein
MFENGDETAMARSTTRTEGERKKRRSVGGTWY